MIRDDMKHSLQMGQTVGNLHRRKVTNESTSIRVKRKMVEVFTLSAAPGGQKLLHSRSNSSTIFDFTWFVLTE